MRYSIAILVLGGCAYQPGSFAHVARDFHGQRATVGCLDVAVERRTDVAVGPVLAYQFANRCDHAATVDLASVKVVARDVAGEEVALRPYDPRSELRSVPLDGRTTGEESIAYPTDRWMRQLCVDVAVLAHERQQQWLCIGTTAGPPEPAPRGRESTVATAGSMP